MIIVDDLANNNSYASLAEAEQYFSSRLFVKEWNKASNEDKEKALIMATSIIDTLSFSGRQYKQGNPGSEDYQRLKWPRYPDYHDPYLLGIPHLFDYSTATREWVNNEGTPIVPSHLKFAVCEEAYFLLCSGRGLDKREHIKAQGLNSVSFSNVNESYAATTAICPAAMRHLLKLNCIESSLRIVRG